MVNYKYILFDLDGTLTDPMMGITKSVAYALKIMKGLTVESEDLTKFIGPPLEASFMNFCHMTQNEAQEAIRHYRIYFKKTGIYENEIYDGIKSLLEKLSEEGADLMVATSKPTVFAELILKYFEIDQNFTHIVGSNLDGSRVNKSEVIEEVIKRAGIVDKKKIIMIGDREHDIIGANLVKIDSIGVTYGYGSLEELQGAGASFIAQNLGDLKKILMT